MIIKASERKVEVRDAMREGPGSVQLTAIVPKEELNNKGRLFSNIHLEPGCGIGVHQHDNESEIFCIISGEAVYNDNGTEVTVTPGDVTVCKSGQKHAITNKTDKPVDLVALIVLD